MTRPKRKPEIGATVTFPDSLSNKTTFKGTVVELLSSQFIVQVTHINNCPNPMTKPQNWKQFVFYTDDWKPT